MVTATIPSTENSSTEKVFGRQVSSKAEQKQNPDAETTAGFIDITKGADVLWINTFAPEPYRVLRPIPVRIVPSDRGWIASLYDANIHASGDTEGEAFENVRSLMLEAYEMLSEEKPATLGPEPAKQLARLRHFIAPMSPLSRVRQLLQRVF
jgi:hypothetical protein